MEQKCQVLETLKPSNNIANVKEIQAGKQQRRSPRDSKTFVATTESKCVLCSKSHHLFESTVFLWPRLRTSVFRVLSHITCLNEQCF